MRFGSCSLGKVQRVTTETEALETLEQEIGCTRQGIGKVRVGARGEWGRVGVATRGGSQETYTRVQCLNSTAESSAGLALAGKYICT